MNPPDYKNYSIDELLEALEGVDRTEFSDRASQIEAELLHRKRAGYSITASSKKENFLSSHISFYDIALPIWWQFIWRNFVGTFLLSIFFIFVISTIAGFLNLSQWIWVPIVTILNCAIFIYVGIFTTRQALTAKYKNFHIQIVPNKAPKAK